MRLLVIVLLGVIGCATTLDTTFEDADLHARVSQDGGRVLLTLLNKTAEPLLVDWTQLSLVSPNHVESSLPTAAEGSLAPGQRVVVKLPLKLSASRRPAALQELIVSTVIRGTPREYHYRLRAAHALQPLPDGG